MGNFIPAITEKYELMSENEKRALSGVYKYDPELAETTEKVIEIIKETEPTYQRAYSILNLVHSQLEYESKFARVPKL
ncbi:hypothetical protein BU107_11090 [Staphylococcus xylosus]|uniref:hypothetical protein n=1 Tax=Staphylococcus xylosus TaxID=1288 RepID=UPI000E6A0734|nr:hypothetical protein [Staphylococcus xylosus]RIM85829.1 hypothetical protein BU107_11090 [Staphylococcus xylosus]